MFTYQDYEHDRIKVRQRFMDEVNKKTTLEDIGRLLDKFLIDEQAEGSKFLDLATLKNAEQVRTLGKKDQTNLSLSWVG